VSPYFSPKSAMAPAGNGRLGVLQLRLYGVVGEHVIVHHALDLAELGWT
jgi:hypothetical protein